MAGRAPIMVGGFLALAAVGSAVFFPLHYSERVALVFIGAPAGAVIGAQLAGRSTRRDAVRWLIGFGLTIAFGILLVAGFKLVGVIG